MKSFFVITTLLLVVVFVALTTATSGIEASPPLLHRLHHRSSSSSDRGLPPTCLGNITAAGSALAICLRDVIAAVEKCPKPNSTQECVYEITSAATELSQAALDISEAVQACSSGGHIKTACEDAVFTISKDLTAVATEIDDAVTDCTNNKDAQKCVADVLDILTAVDQAMMMVDQAIKNC